MGRDDLGGKCSSIPLQLHSSGGVHMCTALCCALFGTLHALALEAVARASRCFLKPQCANKADLEVHLFGRSLYVNIRRSLSPSLAFYRNHKSRGTGSFWCRRVAMCGKLFNTRK